MGYLAAPLDVVRREGDTIIRPVKASATIYKGAFVESNGGYMQRWGNTTNKFAGVAESGTNIPISGVGAGVVGTVDGWTAIPVRRKGLVKIAYSSAAISDLGSKVYATDDNTITLVDGGSYIQIGVVADYEAGYLWVDITGYAV